LQKRHKNKNLLISEASLAFHSSNFTQTTRRAKKEKNARRKLPSPFILYCENLAADIATNLHGKCPTKTNFTAAIARIVEVAGFTENNKNEGLTRVTNYFTRAAKADKPLPVIKRGSPTERAKALKAAENAVQILVDNGHPVRSDVSKAWFRNVIEGLNAAKKIHAPTILSSLLITYCVLANCIDPLSNKDPNKFP
jgi:hypothetical protein